MAYFSSENVKISAVPSSVQKYCWGDEQIAFVRCSKCGCLSHWESLDPKGADRMGVNARLFTNVDIEKIQVRRFDGADTWKFLDK